MGIDEGWIDDYSDGYPIGANSIGSSPSSSRFDDYSAMVLGLSKNVNILSSFSPSTISGNSPQFISTLSIK